MRTIWVLILFGSLIIHHCFTTTSGEAVPATKDAQPSYSDCKPYVDAALKGDVPLDPADLSKEDETPDQSTEDDTPPPEDVGDDSSEEEQHKEHGGSSEEDEDKEEPEINGLEIEEEDEDEAAGGTGGPTAATTESSEEEEEAPPQPPPNPTPPPQGSSKTKAEDRASSSDAASSQESDEDERDGGKGAESHSAPATPQPNRAASHSLAKDAHQSAPPPTNPPAATTQAENTNKKVSNPTKEAKPEVKKSALPATPAESEEDSVEEIIEKTTLKDTKSKKVEDSNSEEVPQKKGKKQAKSQKIDDDDDDDSGEVVQKPVKKESKSKSKKVEDDDDDSEEIVVQKPSKAKKSPPKKIEVEDDDDDNSSEEIQTKAKSKKPAKKVPETESNESESEEVTSKAHKKGKVTESKAKVTSAKKAHSDEDDDDDRSDEKDYEPRSRENLIRILGLDDTTDLKQKNGLLDKVTQQTLKELKSTYEYAIKPLETLYKYRDLSNRHFGDPEIFSKPMVVFMGPWSGGKSTIINWLLGIQDDEHALRTGADPSPAQFNILTHGSEEEVLDGTQLAADWTFSGLQKFGQSFLDRLRGRKLPNRLLEKVNLVEIPGILEIRKQVERSFPFNDACQWFIDRADVLFLVYDPAKLDIGPETEAILDQLKGRESQVRIVLNKADSVRPDELLRVQATLIWNISPLMASAEPPVLYVASLWDHPLQPDAAASLLNAHENLFLKDISDATLKRVETRIAAARRFAVRVRNHAKMCDCYLNTYNNHRSFFSNKKRISDDIIEHPQNYHIYEGLSTLTNISRYDLPDPDSYRDFFRLNPVWEFPTLASTCTYFRGCPINKLDIAIAYDLPELLGRYRRQRESIVTAPTGTLPDIKLKDVAEKKDAPLDIPKGKSRWYKLPIEEQQAEGAAKAKAKEAPPPPPPAPSKKAVPAPPVSKAEQPPKPKNKWWKEVPQVVAKAPEVTAKEGGHKKKKEEVVVKKLEPKEGFKIIERKNKWWGPYYEPIKSKVDSQPQLPKKNKWYKT